MPHAEGFAKLVAITENLVLSSPNVSAKEKVYTTLTLARPNATSYNLRQC